MTWNIKFGKNDFVLSFSAEIKLLLRRTLVRQQFY